MAIERRLVSVMAIAATTAWMHVPAVADECPPLTSCLPGGIILGLIDTDGDGDGDAFPGGDVRIAYSGSEHAEKGFEQARLHRGDIVLGTEISSLFPAPNPTANLSSSRRRRVPRAGATTSLWG